MKTKLLAGHEIDMLTKDELREVLGLVLSEQIEQFRKSSTEHVRAELQTVTDGTGAASINVYQVPIGMKFRLARLVVASPGFSFAAKFTNAAGAIEVRRNAEQLIDGVNLNPSAAAGDQSVGIPWVQTYSSDARPEWQNGEQVTVNVIAGPATANITALVEGELYPQPRARRS